MKLITETIEDLQVLTEERTARKTTKLKASLCKRILRTVMVEFIQLKLLQKKLEDTQKNL